MARIIIADDDEIVGAIACQALLDAMRVISQVWSPWVRSAPGRARQEAGPADTELQHAGHERITLTRRFETVALAFKFPVLILTGRTSKAGENFAHYHGAND